MSDPKQLKEAKERQAKRDRFAMAALPAVMAMNENETNVIVEVDKPAAVQEAFALAELAIAISERYLQDDLDTQLTGGADESIPEPADRVPERT